MLGVLIFLVLHWYLSLFSQTFFLHRYSAHKMFKLSPFWEKFFYLFTYITQGSSYLSPRAYAILHRMHHAYSDTEKDPHSPHFSSNVFTMMWKTKNIYNDYLNRRKTPEKQFDRNYPEWNIIERMGDSYLSRIAWGTLYVLIYIYFAPPWPFYFLLPIHFLMGPIQGAIVNWGGHKYGYSNYDNKDFSRNTLLFDFLMLGELFQNNHHTYPNRADFATKWYEVDPVYPIIKVLDKVGVIELRDRPSAVKKRA